MAQVSARPITTKDMIIHAVAGLNEKRGSNPIAIRKYLNDHYDVSQSRAVMITKLLRRAPDEGWLTQISGSGASSGSYFKLPAEAKKELQKAAAVAEKSKKEPQRSRSKARASSETGKKRTSKSAEKDAQAVKKKRAQPAKSPKEKAAAKKKTG